MTKIGFKFESDIIKEQQELEREEYEAMIVGFCDSLYEALFEMETEEGDKAVINIHECIYGDMKSIDTKIDE